jgi:hypothetical protein
MKSLKNIVIGFVLFVSLAAIVSVFNHPAQGQTTFRAPTVYQGAVATSIYWTAGNINNGGHAVVITAGSAALGAARTDCSAPGFAACDFLYATSAGGALLVSNVLSTAAAAGNTIVALIETNGGSVPTKISTPLQAGSLWNKVTGPIINYCGTTVACGNTVVSGRAIEVFGTVALDNTGVASHAIVTGVSPPYLATTSYTCNATPAAAADATTDVWVVNNTGASFTIWKTASSTATYAYHCIGY